eukprot:jgi/Phyca11/15212/fgenesh1_pg.PHYCAscaffold_12_\
MLPVMHRLDGGRSAVSNSPLDLSASLSRPNGIGKSTLLTALGDGLVEGLPASLKILYVNQLDTSSLTPETAQQSVLRTVLSADTRVIMEAKQAQEAAMTEETIFFRGYDKTLAYYEGNYDSFELAMARKQQYNARLQTKLDKKTEQMSAMVSKINQQASRSKDDKKMQVAASKKKKMDRIGNERSAKGTRFKLNRDRAGYFLTGRDQAEDQAKYDVTEGGSSAWRIFSNSPPQIRNLTKLDDTTMISMENVSFRYDSLSAGTDKPKLPLVLDKLNLTINYGDKVVLVGRNGADILTNGSQCGSEDEGDDEEDQVYGRVRVFEVMPSNVSRDHAKFVIKQVGAAIESHNDFVTSYLNLHFLDILTNGSQCGSEDEDDDEEDQVYGRVRVFEVEQSENSAFCPYNFQDAN